MADNFRHSNASNGRGYKKLPGKAESAAYMRQASSHVKRSKARSEVATRFKSGRRWVEDDYRGAHVLTNRLGVATGSSHFHNNIFGQG